jgi:flagellar basal-body rod protein FlgC
MRIDTNLQALMALGVEAQATAHNIANVNTQGFQAQRVDLETGPGGQGVHVGDVLTDQTTGPMVQRLQRTEDPETGRVETSWQYVEGSNTDLAREMVNLTATQRAFEANVAAVRTQSEMLGTLVNDLAHRKIMALFRFCIDFLLALCQGIDSGRRTPTATRGQPR